jgi:4-hydroxybenzoate polyprenyltransferase
LTRTLWVSSVVLGAVVSALFWIDPIFVPLALLGPLVIGGFAGARRLPWLWPATVAVVAGLGAVVSDWVVNREDVAFHLVLTVVMLTLAVGAWRVGVAVQSRRANA